MTSSIKSFLKKNKKQAENIKLKLASFDEEIDLRVISGKEYDAIQASATRYKAGKGGRQERVFDQSKLTRELCIASIAFPDMDNAELQASYGVLGSSDLYDAMFNWSEQLKISEAVMKASGLEDFEDLVEEAKN